MTASRLNDAGFWRGELLEVLDLARNRRLHAVDDVDVRKHPIPVGVRVLVGAFERIASEVEDLRRPELHERFEPAHQLVGALLHQHDLPVLHPDAEDVAVVAHIEEDVPWALLRFAGEIRQHVHPVDVDLKGLVAHLVAVEKLGRDIRLSGGGEQRRQPVLMADDAVQHRARLELARPAHEGWHPPATLPVGVLLRPERGDAGVRP